MKPMSFEETKSISLTEQQISELKKVELEMLKIFISICEENGFRYYVVGGTALGAVRHKGFIPWDDDIDVAMPRNDYEKFMKTAQLQLPDYLFLQNIYTDPVFPMNFAKIRNSNTTFVESSCARLKMNHGIYLDIFPLDGFPANKLSEKIFLFKDRLLKKRISNVYIIKDKLRSNLFKKIINYILLIIYPDYKKTVLKRERLLKKYSYETSKIIGNYSGAWYEKEIMPKEIFGKGTIGSFEGIQVILPEKYDEYLSRMYGNYMELPPVEKRIAHHYCDAIDFEKSYLEYVKDEKICAE